MEDLGDGRTRAGIPRMCPFHRCLERMSLRRRSSWSIHSSIRLIDSRMLFRLASGSASHPSTRSR
jgi:hypothetical protein